MGLAARGLFAPTPVRSPSPEDEDEDEHSYDPKRPPSRRPPSVQPPVKVTVSQPGFGSVVIEASDAVAGEDGSLCVIYDPAKQGALQPVHQQTYSLEWEDKKFESCIYLTTLDMKRWVPMTLLVFWQKNESEQQ